MTPTRCWKIKSVLNQTECVALAHLLRSADETGAELTLVQNLDDDGTTMIEVIVGEFASKIILQRKQP